MRSRGMPRSDAQPASAAALSELAWITSTPSLRARAVTTGFVSVERISTGIPAPVRRATPMPSERLTVTNSSPSCPISTVSSVCTPSKSVTTASTRMSLVEPVETLAEVSTRPWRRSRHAHGRPLDQRDERVRQLELLERVDLEGGGLRHDGDPDAAEEPVVGRAEGRGIHHVEGARLEVFEGAILAARPGAQVVVDARHPVGIARDRAPEETPGLDGREHRIRLADRHPVDGRIQIAGVDERRCRLQEHEDADADAASRQRVERVLEGALGARGIAGDAKLDGPPPRLPTRAPPRRSRRRRSRRRPDRRESAASALVIARAISGMPPTRRRFLRGMPFEPPRAGMTATVSPSRRAERSPRSSGHPRRDRRSHRIGRVHADRASAPLEHPAERRGGTRPARQDLERARRTREGELGRHSGVDDGDVRQLGHPRRALVDLRVGAGGS